MTINYENNTIEMSKTEAKTAGKYGSEKFNELRTLKAAEPTFRVVIVKSAAKRGDHFKGLTYDYMKDYIEKHPMNVEVEDESGEKQTKSAQEIFYELRGLDKNGKKMKLAAAATYGEIKMWFLTQSPEIEAMSANVSKIIDNARKVRIAQRAAA